uniref:Uncharacterized protein n=1 Tax=Leersia perrieri TaxID=77586 RepID=A0A0D9VLH5_9ORYZ
MSASAARSTSSSPPTYCAAATISSGLVVVVALAAAAAATRWMDLGDMAAAGMWKGRWTGKLRSAADEPLRQISAAS